MTEAPRTAASTNPKVSLTARPTVSVTTSTVQPVAAGDPDLMLFGADPVAQMSTGQAPARLAAARAVEPRPVTRAVAPPAVHPAMASRSAPDADEMDLMDIDAGPARPNRLSVSVQQQTFAEVGRDFDPDLDSSGKMVVFASTRHSSQPNLYIQSAKGRAVTQLTDDGARDVQPRFSPDGKKVVFASDRNGQWDIYILDLEQRTTMQVTHSQDHELTPAWSPDGKWIVYSRLSSVSGLWELWMASLDDHSERCIGQGMMPRFSPDGSHIAFQKARGRDGKLFSIWTMKLTDGEPSWPAEVAAEPDAALICPVWSPDGERIAYCRVPASGVGNKPTSGMTRPSQADLYVVEADGSERVRVVDGGANFGPVWSNEGRIFFSADRDGRERIWSLRIAGSTKPNLASTAMGGLPQ